MPQRERRQALHRLRRTVLCLALGLTAASLLACSIRGNSRDEPFMPSPTVAADATAMMERSKTPVSTASATSTTASEPETPTRVVATRTPTVDDTATPDAVASLLPMLLTEADLPDGWLVDRAGPVLAAEETGERLCGGGTFPDTTAKRAEVEAEFSFANGSEPVYLYENLVHFADRKAVDAMAWARSTSNCGSWVSSDGVQFSVLPTASPQLGDDSFAVAFSFTGIQGQTFAGRWVFVRVGPVIATLAYLGVDGTDFSAAQLLIRQAVSRMEEMRMPS